MFRNGVWTGKEITVAALLLIRRVQQKELSVLNVAEVGAIIHMQFAVQQHIEVVHIQSLVIQLSVFV
jgi:hypothetical protein